MKVDYDEVSKKYIFDFKGTTTFTKNNFGIEFTKSFVDNDKGLFVIKNMNVIGKYDKTFKQKIKNSINVLKIIWR